MAKRKNRTTLGVIGVLLVIFGVTGTIPVLLNKEYLLGLPITALAVIIGVILISMSIRN